MGPQVVYIYPDIAFIVSFLMNSLVLWGTAKINKLTRRRIRILAGAAAGALYSFAAAFPQAEFLHNFWIKVLFSAAMVTAAFAPLNIRRFLASMAVFYIVSFSLGGFFFGILYFFQSSPLSPYLINTSQMIARYFLPGLVLTVGIYIVFTKFGIRIFQKRMVQDLFRVPIKVLFGQSEVEVEALIDTGNQLQEPLSQTPVVVVEYDVLKNIFPAEVQTAFEHGNDPDLMLILNSLAETPWATRFRVIPFTSLGRENGMLIGFRPDRIEILNKGNPVSTKNVIVGVYRRELSPGGGYRALLHPDVLDGMTA